MTRHAENRDMLAVAMRTSRLPRWALRIAPIALITALVSLCLVAPQPASATGKAVTVEVTNFVFTPKVLTVTAGTTVTWINQDDIPHTVASTEGTFNSGALDTEDVFTFAFTTPGVYNYFCSLHPKMTGKVVVRPADG